MFAAARPRNIDLRPTARTDIALRGWAGRLVRRLRIPGAAAQGEQSLAARFHRADASYHEISNTSSAYGFLSSNLTCPANQCGLCGPCPVCKNTCDIPKS
jgi:hypothetical protein